MIRAECHSDDFVHAVKFDATPWFEQASITDIRDLAECDWGGDYPADAVAQHVANLAGYDRISALFNHVGPTTGFEVHIDFADAIVWLRESRPEAYEHLRDLVAGIDRVQRLPDGSLSWDISSSWSGDYDKSPAVLTL